MKSIVLWLLVSLFATTSFSQYKPVDNGSSIQFKVKNVGLRTTGSLSGLQGSIRFDPSHPENAAFDVSVSAGSVNTDNKTRDKHLSSDSYFDAQQYPRIRFVSTRVIAGGNDGQFTLAGKLTIKGTTREVSFPFTASKSGDGYLFKGSFSINRKDFGVGGSNTISNNVDVSLSVLGKK